VWRRHHLAADARLSVLREALPDLELVADTPRSFAARLLKPGDLHHAIEHLASWVSCWPDGGEESDPSSERALLERVLTEEAATILKSHKGTVEIESYDDRVLALRLGGGCAGCASAAVTTQRELAAALYRAVPLLDQIRGAS
jgi:Fe-S cluster biogenesis protein NfuA